MKRRGVLRVFSAAFSLLVLCIGLGFVGLIHPKTPLPPHWNPTTALDIKAPPTPVTRWKIARTSDGAACFAALSKGSVGYSVLPDLTENSACGIRDRVVLRSVAGISMDPVETKCATALRLALWAEHGVKPAARSILRSDVTRLQHYSSYSCRPIRTSSGSSGRMSTHATAEAIDIAGFTMADGRHLTLQNDWNNGAEGVFLQAAFGSACEWFVTALGPDYNALHADHFHLQSRGWGLCR